MSGFDVPAYDALTDAIRPDAVEIALASFLSRGAAIPFRWGVRDCALWACEWVLERRGVDPLADYRGTYALAEEARAIMAPHGGLAGLMTQACALAGLERVETSRLGDIGIVGTLMGPAVMIATDDGRWAGKAPRGVTILRASPVNVWRV